MPSRPKKCQFNYVSIILLCNLCIVVKVASRPCSKRLDTLLTWHSLGLNGIFLQFFSIYVSRGVWYNKKWNKCCKHNLYVGRTFKTDNFWRFDRFNSKYMFYQNEVNFSSPGAIFVKENTFLFVKVKKLGKVCPSTPISGISVCP